MALTAYGTSAERQDSLFYCDGSGGPSEVWSAPDCDFYVVACGEMRLYYTNKIGTQYTINDTADLMEIVGITTDKDLYEFDRNNPDENLEWVSNNWFEVASSTDENRYYDDVFESLDSAIQYALELDKLFKAKASQTEEPNVIY